MALEKYYDSFIEDKLISPKSITYFSTKHIINSLIKKDNIKNTPISDLGKNYINKAMQLYKSIEAPLALILDDVYSLYEYTKPHFLRILDNPKNEIIKESEMIRKEKIKTLDSNSFIWLSGKPGINIKEKLANTTKVKSTIKKFTYDTKENQVVKSYLKKIIKLMWDRIYFIEENPDVFGNDRNDSLNLLKIELNRISRKYKDIFEEVKNKENTTPNNTLLGNVSYSSIWNSNNKLKKISPDFKENELFLSWALKVTMLLVMNSIGVDYIENFINIFDDEQFILYVNNDKELIDIRFNFEKNCSIIVTSYNKRAGKLELASRSNFNLILTYNESYVKNRGLCFDLIVNGDIVLKEYADLLGLKSLVTYIFELLGIKFEFKPEKENKKAIIRMLSINSFDNKLISSKNYSNALIPAKQSFLVPTDSLFVLNDNNTYLNKIDSSNYYDYLLKLKKYSSLSLDEMVVYDIKDTFDEFSQVELRKNVSNAFPNSYPVWRSILAAETYGNENIDYVVDLTGDEPYIAKIGRKNNLYVHYGAIESRLNSLEMSEEDFIRNYLSLYEDKYNVNLTQYKEELIRSGKVNSLLNRENSEILIYDDNKYYVVIFDEKIYKECLSKLEIYIDSLKFDYDNICIIVPDFISVNDVKVIKNIDLLVGAEIISNRVKNHKTGWYERLPKLSLEVIRNGYYDDLLLIDNKECENIIGRKVLFSIDEDFILKAGEKNYILPLNKGFLGKENKSFVAKLEDESFPLEKDIKVQLELYYTASNANSYELIFRPLEQAPFEKLVAKWEEETIENNLIYPNINDVIPASEDEIETKYNACKHRIDKIVSDIYYIEKNSKNLFEYIKTANILSNDLERLFAYDKKYINLIKDYSTELNVKDYLVKAKAISQKVVKRDTENVYILEQLVIQLTQKAGYIFDNNYISHPYACFGKALTIKINDNKINKSLIKCIEYMSKTDLLQNHQLRTFIDRISGCSSCNHLFFQELTEKNPKVSKMIFLLVMRVLRELSNYQFKFDRDPVYDTKVNNYKENIYLMRHILEILIGYIYARDNVYFMDIRPNGRTTKEILYCLKKFNKNFKNVKEWPEGKKANTRLRYKMRLDEIPSNLYNMWMELYCVILYYSGSKDANYIVIGSEDYGK